MSEVRDPEADQQLPVQGTVDVQEALIRAIKTRRDLGVRKYGRPLEAHNGRDALLDAWQEAVDLAAYLTQMRIERGDII